MDAKELPARPNLEQYKKLAKDLVKAFRSADSTAMRRIKDHFQLERPPTWEELHAATPRRSGKPSDSAIRSPKFVLADAQFLIARWYGFESWPAFRKHVEAFARKSSPVSTFESAVEAVITGDAATLDRLLHENPELVRARSTRVHQSMLLHYVSANGVEDYRQKTPKNAVEVAKILLKAGAEVDAENNPGRDTTLGLVATSIHPAHAGVQIALLETLLAAGAAIDRLAGGWNPLTAALANGRREAAEYLARRGARLDLEGAAGVGRLDLVKSFFTKDGSLKADATKAQMESGFMWACEYGRNNVVEFLLDKGLDVGTQVHGMTGLHWAVVGGQLDTIKLLLERGASLEAKNAYGGTALGQALWSAINGDPGTDYARTIETLIAAGAEIEPGSLTWLAQQKGPSSTAKARIDEVLRRHGAKT